MILSTNVALRFRTYRELTVANISVGENTLGAVGFLLEGGKKLITSIFDLTGRYGYYPKDAYDTRDLLDNIQQVPAVAESLKLPKSKRQEAGKRAFESIGLTEQDFQAFTSALDLIKESRTFNERLDGHHEEWKPVEPGSFWRNRNR